VVKSDELGVVLRVARVSGALLNKGVRPVEGVVLKGLHLHYGVSVSHEMGSLDLVVERGRTVLKIHGDDI